MYITSGGAIIVHNYKDLASQVRIKYNFSPATITSTSSESSPRGLLALQVYMPSSSTVTDDSINCDMMTVSLMGISLTVPLGISREPLCILLNQTTVGRGKPKTSHSSVTVCPGAVYLVGLMLIIYGAARETERTYVK